MNRIRVSKKAIADLDDIWVYTADAWSVDQASKYYLQIINAIRNLTNLPDYLIRKYDSVKEGLYGYHVGHHIIFYKKRMTVQFGLIASFTKEWIPQKGSRL